MSAHVRWGRLVVIGRPAAEQTGHQDTETKSMPKLSGGTAGSGKQNPWPETLGRKKARVTDESAAGASGSMPMRLAKAAADETDGRTIAARSSGQRAAAGRQQASAETTAESEHVSPAAGRQPRDARVSGAAPDPGCFVEMWFVTAPAVPEKRRQTGQQIMTGRARARASCAKAAA